MASKTIDVTERHDLQELLAKLQYAKKATASCLKSGKVLVDMQGLSYWAGQVETLRRQFEEAVEEVL